MAKAKDETTPQELPGTDDASSNGATGDPDTGQLLDQQTMDELSLLDLDPGGDIPSHSVLKLKACETDIANQFKRPSEVIIRIHARLTDILFEGDSRVHVFKKVSMFQDEDLDEALIERFKDKLEDYGVDDDTRVAIIDFLDSCGPELEPEGEEVDPEAEAALSAPDEPPEEELGEEGTPSGDDEEEVIDGVVVDEDPEIAGLEDAAGDLEWSGQPPPEDD